MNDDKCFDEIIEDLYMTKQSILAASDLVPYMKDAAVLDELELIRSTMHDAMQRFRVGMPLDNLPAFHLLIKQIKIMSDDLVEVCTKKITAMA